MTPNPPKSRKERKWKSKRHSQIDKSFEITGPNDFKMVIDFDDVDHKEVNRVTKKMLNILNKYLRQP